MTADSFKTTQSGFSPKFSLTIWLWASS